MGEIEWKKIRLAEGWRMEGGIEERNDG